MDWVETTGKTLDEATDRALAHLGVHRDDAEVEILEEPKAGMFGRIRGEARVRARVRPTGPRPKRSRRTGGREELPRNGEVRDSGKKKTAKAKTIEVDTARIPREKTDRGDVRKNTNSSVSKSKKDSSKENSMAEGITLAEQGAIGKGFLEGLLSAMKINAEVVVREIDEETIELSVNANPPTELGVLVGPRGTTLQALQEVTRTVVQSKSPARTDRILVDVAQYRERRVAALGRFANQVALEVRDSGEERALEPMAAADRKAVHDALAENASVITRSEGEEPRRFVVVSPA